MLGIGKEEKTEALDWALQYGVKLAVEVLEKNGFTDKKSASFKKLLQIMDRLEGRDRDELLASVVILKGSHSVKLEIEKGDALTAAVTMGLVAAFTEKLSTLLGKEETKPPLGTIFH